MGDRSGFTIELDYAIHPQPRYGHGKPPHPQLTAILDRSRARYAAHLRSFVPLAENLARIPVDDDERGPHWNNVWFSGIDPASLYGFLAVRDPAHYFEVGSGHSTMFARQAIRDHGLRTRITSIDPHPRADIDRFCDEVVRQPLEQVDLGIFETLGEGDVLFVDNSHRVFTNSDATVVFLDVMPALRSGVLLGIHDIMLPRDYPPRWAGRYYSEQYVLAAYLLAEGSKFDVELPCSFVGMREELKAILSPVWERLPDVNPSGSTFWLQMR